MPFKKMEPIHALINNLEKKKKTWWILSSLKSLEKGLIEMVNSGY